MRSQGACRRCGLRGRVVDAASGACRRCGLGGRVVNAASGACRRSSLGGRVVEAASGGWPGSEARSPGRPGRGLQTVRGVTSRRRDGSWAGMDKA